MPCLQEVLDAFALVRLVVGQATPQQVGEVLETLWGGPETLVVSTDQGHFDDHETAREVDRATARAIEALRPESIEEEHACGHVPLQGLLHLARRPGLRARTVDLRTSGHTGGPRERVVGYGALAFDP